MTFVRLLLLALLVTPVGSCAGSMLTAAGLIVFETAQAGGPGAGEALTGLFLFGFFGTLVALVFVLLGLLVLALPLTLLLDRLQVTPVPRAAVLIAVAGLVGLVIFFPGLVNDQQWGWIMIGYCLTSAVAWVVGLHLLERRNRRRAPLEEHFR